MRDGMPTNGYTCPRCQASCKTTDGHFEVCPARPEVKRITEFEADVDYWKQAAVDAQNTADALRATAEVVERARLEMEHSGSLLWYDKPGHKWVINQVHEGVQHRRTSRRATSAGTAYRTHAQALQALAAESEEQAETEPAEE